MLKASLRKGNKVAKLQKIFEPFSRHLHIPLKINRSRLIPVYFLHNTMADQNHTIVHTHTLPKDLRRRPLQRVRLHAARLFRLDLPGYSAVHIHGSYPHACQQAAGVPATVATVCHFVMVYCSLVILYWTYANMSSMRETHNQKGYKVAERCSR